MQVLQPERNESFDEDIRTLHQVSKIYCTDFNALNDMYVGDIGDGVCGFYATLYAEYRFHVRDVEDTVLCTLYAVAPRHDRREGSL